LFGDNPMTKRRAASRQNENGEGPVLSAGALRMIEEWRLLPGTKYEKEVVTVASRVHRVFRGLGLEEEFTEQELAGAWREIVGDFLAQNARPGAMKRGVLEIVVLQPSILYMLERELKGKVLKNLQERFGPERIRAVRFKIG